MSEACNIIEEETLTQVFHCEFCGISKNTISYRTPPVTGSLGETFYFVNWWWGEKRGKVKFLITRETIK